MFYYVYDNPVFYKAWSIGDAEYREIEQALAANRPAIVDVVSDINIGAPAAWSGADP